MTASDRYPRTPPSEDELIARVVITCVLVIAFILSMAFLYSYVVNRGDTTEELEMQACQTATDPTACLRELEIIRGCHYYASDDDEYVECITSTASE